MGKHTSRDRTCTLVDMCRVNFVACVAVIVVLVIGLKKAREFLVTSYMVAASRSPKGS